MASRAGRPAPSRVDACVAWTLERLRTQVYRPGQRLPSVRAMARLRRVSPYTVVDAYARLVTEGYLEARRGSGFYVRERAAASAPPAPLVRPPIDLRWLMHHMLAGGDARGPGLGVLPNDWLDAHQLAMRVRALGREGPGRWLKSGQAQGFEPLRALVQQRLAALDIPAPAQQIVLTTGITHALDLVLRTQLRPGDRVLVLEPSWFGALGMLAAQGIPAVGVPCTPEGPDLAALERLALQHRPRLMILSAVAHNPTGLSLAAATVRRILDIAARADCLIFEDDVYTDLCRPQLPRFAAADGLRRVVYAASFSKTLAANLRVGYVAAPPQIAEALAEAKVLSGFTTPELNERLVHKLLREGRYARHLRGLRERLDVARENTLRQLRRAGVEVFGAPRDGLFAWVNVHTDTNALAAACRERGWLLAPGSLFSLAQQPTPWMRYNLSTDAALTAGVLRTAAAAPPAGA